MIAPTIIEDSMIVALDRTLLSTKYVSCSEHVWSLLREGLSYLLDATINEVSVAYSALGE